ncbi:MAG: N-6 DNA methylase [Bacteroidetes bacterium]|nr:N-6 DNA methylase [Bacteroidota bacterium]
MSYDVPKEIQDLAKTMNNFSYSNGLDISQVFDDFLVYIISFFTPVVKPIVEWKYSPEQNAVFHTMLIEWVKIMEKQIYLKQWYDAFGDLYMGLIAGSSRTSGRGQFFTPPEICDLMTSAMGDKDIIGKYVSDPTCGSGRTLLSWHVQHLGNYLCAEDIDRTCCMMTVCNMLIHGCEGEVIWHNSLEPDSFLGGWKVNYSSFGFRNQAV